MYRSESDILDHGTGVGSSPWSVEPLVNGTEVQCSGLGPNTGSIDCITPFLENGASCGEWNAGGNFTPPYSYTLDTNSAALKTKLTTEAGWVAVNAPPYITITTDGGNGVGNNFTTSNASVALGGTSSDTSGVGGSVNSVAVTCSPSCGNPTESGTTSWSATVPLQSGDNVITATVTDNGGATFQDTITVTLDTGPTASTPFRLVR